MTMYEVQVRAWVEAATGEDAMAIAIGSEPGQPGERVLSEAVSAEEARDEQAVWVRMVRGVLDTAEAGAEAGLVTRRERP